MAFTRKHYNTIADVLKSTHESHGEQGGHAALDEISKRLSDVFAGENPRFDRGRFDAASKPKPKERPATDFERAMSGKSTMPADSIPWHD